MATSQEIYQNRLNNQQMGFSSKYYDDLIAAVQSGAMTIEEAFPASTPQPGAERMSFGGSYVAPANTNTGSNQQSAEEQAAQAAAEQAAAQAAAEQAAQAAAQEQMGNLAYLEMLRNLGLEGLYAAYAGQIGIDPTTYQSATYQPTQAAQMANMYQPRGMMAGQAFGVAPYRTGYLPPMVVPKSTVASDTGLLQYVMNQGQ